MAIDEVRPPVDRVERVSERCRQAWILDEQHTGPRSAAVVGQRRHHLVAEVPEERGIPVLGALDKVVEPDVPSAAIVGVAAREEIQERVDREVVVVPRAAGIDFESGAVGAHAHAAAAAHLDFLAVGTDRLDEAVVADGDVEPAVDADLDAVDGMVGAAKVEAEAQPADERARLLGDAVAVARRDTR